MTARLLFPAITVFWVTMNVLLWRSEFGAHGGDTPVPVQLVWRKILTAPDSSSLSVYQGENRTGYFEFSTSAGQEMAAMDLDKSPSESLVSRAGYQIHLAGNISLDEFTNRIKFDGRVKFVSARQWQEINLKITSRLATVEIHSLGSNQTVHVRITTDGSVLERELTFAELENPNALVRAFAGNFADALLGTMELPALPAGSSTTLAWEARRTRVRIGTQPVPVYQLETRILDRPITVDVSTLGEIMHVELPGDISAGIDEWTKP